MGFDSTDHERSRDGTAKSPPADNTADTSTWNSPFYGFILMIVGVSAGVIGLNMMTDHTGRIGPLTSEPPAAVGLFVAGVGMLVAGVVLSLTGETSQNGLPFDVDFIPEEPESREVDPENWANLYLAAFLVYSLLFFYLGVLAVYNELFVADHSILVGDFFLGLFLLLLGTVVVDSALMGRDGDILGIWINGGLAAVTTVFGVRILRVDLAFGHSLTPGLLVLILSLIGVTTAVMAYVEHRNTDT